MGGFEPTRCTPIVSSVTVATFAQMWFTTILSGFGFVPGKLNLQNAHG